MELSFVVATDPHPVSNTSPMAISQRSATLVLSKHGLIVVRPPHVDLNMEHLKITTTSL
ncbi:hypothetical protein M378DRAFT_160196 [Amanita muscaria Koide BX008]|uniref:Uncharacterized protein n=1 Tax=Amanita muscaria (strain Koide BX008) TaxID=946122 RepID=A0A0C2STL5_AMAMK|nr:hypothetical protein M378DRAFT_160196 [Amanita muscaria Koide BX008]